MITRWHISWQDNGSIIIEGIIRPRCEHLSKNTGNSWVNRENSVQLTVFGTVRSCYSPNPYTAFTKSQKKSNFLFSSVNRSCSFKSSVVFIVKKTSKWRCTSICLGYICKWRNLQTCPTGKTPSLRFVLHCSSIWFIESDIP